LQVNGIHLIIGLVKPAVCRRLDKLSHSPYRCSEED
jgi:hypothetical protein